MKAVYFGFPARSHTVPSLAIVRELVKRGVEVEYFSTVRYRDVVERAGARFAAYPAICESLAEPADLASHTERLIDGATQILPELLRAVDRRTALVLLDGSAPWGWILARQRAVPSAASITTFAFTRGLLQMLKTPGGRGTRLENKLARLNAEYGISLCDGLDVLVAGSELKVVFTSRLFQPAGQYFDHRHIFVGPVLEPRAEGVRAGVDGLRPLAYVSLGTIFNQDFNLLRSIGGRLSSAGWRVVLSLGDAGRTVAGEWPEGVEVYPFVDQMATLSRAGLFVTHGGMASVSEGLAYGVPMLIVPQQVDQFLVARRTAELGAGIVIAGEAAEGEWQAAMALVDREPMRFRAAAARIGESFRQSTPLSDAVERVLELASGREASHATRG